MREIRSYGSVGERGGNELLYPECLMLVCGNLQMFENQLGYGPNKHEAHECAWALQG